MRVAQSHPGPRVAEQARNYRQRHPLHHGVAREGVAKVVQAHVLDSCLTPRLPPERQLRRAGPRRISRRGKHVGLAVPGLSPENGPGLRVQENRPRSRLAVGQAEHVPVDLRPAQVDELALPASGQQQEPDDGRLLAARRPALMGVERGVQAADLGAGQKAGRLRPRIALHAPGRIGGDVAAGDGVVQDLTQDVERAVGAAGRGSAVAVEPGMHLRSVNPVEPSIPEAGKQLPLKSAVRAPAGRWLASVVAGRVPGSGDEVPKCRRGHAQPSRAAPTASAASRTIESAKWVYFRVVAGSRCPSRRPMVSTVSPRRRAKLA